MDLTQNELRRVAVVRYWKQNRRSVLVGFLVIVNLIAFCLLGLYVTGNFPYKAPITAVIKTYELNEDIVSVSDGRVVLNGSEMQLVSESTVTPEAKPNYTNMLLVCSLGAITLYYLYHAYRAKTFGRNLVEGWISKEKFSE